MSKSPVLFVPVLMVALTIGACSSSGRNRSSSNPPAATYSSSSTSSSSASNPDRNTYRSSVADYTEVLKLYRANLSEDFILQRIREDQKVYSLTADRVIELRNNGVSERVIAAMQQSGTGRSIPEDRIQVSASSSDSGSRSSMGNSMSSAARMNWEGLARRNSGIVMLKSRWDVGTLTYDDGQVRWVDSKDSTKNLLIPERAIAEQFRTCLKKAGGNECFEWGFRTKSGEEYRFRDVSWEQGMNDKPNAVHDFFKARFPNVIDSNRPVDDK